ncbi:DNA mismatch repair protein MutT [Bacillus sp. TS-2]|nr:DNA mismatch repair protein MutT [Bacillus sp. TS-2]
MLCHIVGRFVGVGGRYVVKVGTRTSTKQAPEKARNALSSFNPTYISIGSGRTVALQNSNMNHILTNHHLLYWTGATGKSTVHFNLTVNHLHAKVISVINSNKSKIIRDNGYSIIDVRIDGQAYRLYFLP